MTATVLLVDDDQNVLHGLARLLRNQPYTLLTVRSADEAMWTMKTRPVDLVVADERMPGICGTDLLVWTATHFPDTIRIMLTGYATAENAIRAINEAGVHRFFTKPCKDVELALAIRKALEQREAPSDRPVVHP